MAPPVPDGGNDGTKDLDTMEVDQDAEESTLISPASSSKRKLTSDEDDTLTFQSGYPPLTPTATSTSSVRFSDQSSEPSRKKSARSTSSVATSAKSQLKVAPSRQSRATRSAQSSSESRAPLSSHMLVHEMHGSINMLTTTLRDTAMIDPVTKVRQDAVNHILNRDDGLTDDQKLQLINMFTATHALNQTYLVFSDRALRRRWLLGLLGSSTNTAGEIVSSGEQ
jgi:hypothetical protein